MKQYVVKMNSEKVRLFSGVTLDKVSEWARLHCRGKVEIVELTECGLPRACSRMYPNEDMPELRHRPFVSLA